MATFGDKTAGSQNACEYMDYLVKLEKARKITLFLNGDKNFFGAQMLVNKRHFRTWDAFLNASTEKTGVNSAVRFITTPVNGTRLDGLDDLQDRESYVAITRGSFKPIGYAGLSDRYKQYSSNNIHSTSSILKIRPVEHSRIQVPGKIGQIQIQCHAIMINVYLNGKDFDAPFRIALSQKVQKKWELVMKEIAEHVVGMMGRPRALYTVDGSKVITNSADLEPGGMYVIVGSEPGGFQRYCYGCQSRAKHPQKLPPIRKRRRRPKKKVEKEMSSFDVAHPAEGTVEVISFGDQEPQQDNKEFVPVATSQGDMPPQPNDSTLYAESSPVKSPLARQSLSTPKSGSPVGKTASGKIEKVSSSPFKVVPYDSLAERLNYKSSSEVLAKGSVENSQSAGKVTIVIEQPFALQATDTEEETETEMEEETEQELGEETEQELEIEAGKVVEIEKEKEMSGEQTDPLYDEEFTRPNTVGIVSDVQQDSEKDEVNLEATHSFHAVDLSAANSEIAGPPPWTREVDSGGQLDQADRNSNQENAFLQSPIEDDKTLTENKDEPATDIDANEFLRDDKPRSETNTDVKEETDDPSKQGSTPAAMVATDSDASGRVAEQYVQSEKGSDKALTEGNDEPAYDKPRSKTNVKEEGKYQSKQGSTPALTVNNDESDHGGHLNDSLLDDRPQSRTNVEEKAKDRSSEQEPAPSAMDINDSDASEQAKRISSDAPVRAEVSEIATPLSRSETRVEKDPSELHTNRSSSTKTDIQPHR